MFNLLRKYSIEQFPLLFCATQHLILINAKFGYKSIIIQYTAES
ncbi:hypothetical protein M527_13480 [Sphingobium indicum IP26]|nr:hypothetical protein M527_19250 [Sphingobium indicum IP26]EPR16838.1 hypothetical protein M527_19080 [Sphingobium indicum IP26]EPR18223.1 hypothetical protein M527_13480 [Sphingobium indicum IP26]EQA97124.1 hypothetical protein L286_22615 [Sphingobium sp. HDIP04]